MLTSRRSFLGLLAAPAIVRASSLMRVVPLPEPQLEMIVGEWHGMTFFRDEPVWMVHPNVERDLLEFAEFDPARVLAYSELPLG